MENSESEKLKRKEEILNEAIIRSIPGAFYVFDEKGMYVRWNDFQRDVIIGKSEEEISSVNAIETIHPDDRKLVQSKINNVFQGGKSEIVEGRVLIHGGPDFKWLLMTGQRFSIDKKPFLVGIGIDITEQKKEEEERKNSEILLQRIIDLLPIRVFWKDKDLKYLGCNKIFAHDAGKEKPEELVGNDDFQMTWKNQANLYQKDDRKVIESGTAKTNFEEPQTTPEGNTIWLRTSKVPLTDNEDATVGILGMYEDITESKESEEERMKRAEELELMNRSMVGRELKMVELKNEIEELKKKLQTYEG